jgi:shikimate kinase
MNIVLIGFMGTGKTVVGEEISRRLNWSFYDTDRMIEKETKLTVPEIFAKGGESDFRDMEAKTAALLGWLDRSVIATGGGLPLRDENMRELEKNGLIVWLAAKPATIVERLKNQFQTRPLLKGGRNPLADVEELLNARRRAYARAGHTVETDGLTPSQVAEAVLKLLPADAAR